MMLHKTVQNHRKQSSAASTARQPRSTCRTWTGIACVMVVVVHGLTTNGLAQRATATDSELLRELRSVEQKFSQQVQPFLQRHCLHCHDADTMESGIRVDQLDGKLADRNVRLWTAIRRQVAEKEMPPEDEEQPSAEERGKLIAWIDHAIHVARSRPSQKNGSIRRLTVAQYRNTLRDLLGLEDDLTDILPPDAISKDGFVNNEQEMILSPLLLEAYFEIADRALDLCIVDPADKPVIQNFRVQLGHDINPDPCPDKLILGANSHLLRNRDFVVTELQPPKPFDYHPFRMRTTWRFHEGYQGNSTVRGWRDYNSIYHAVFACMRGSGGYPKGRAYEATNARLLLRPAIPSAELFGISSTYGPQANFKIAVRELPDTGRFRVTVNAAKYADGLLCDRGEKIDGTSDPIVINPDTSQSINVTNAGIYQVRVFLKADADHEIVPDDSGLNEQLVGIWSLNETANSNALPQLLTGEASPTVKFTKSPFGKAAKFDGRTSVISVVRDPSMNVGSGDFTIAAWIHPDQLRQAGIVSMGRYNYSHGWVFDMPNNRGVLRIETMNPDNQRNGTVQSRPGVIRKNQWQHVAAVVRRGEQKTRLYVNGYEVAVGEIGSANLDNPDRQFLIGRIDQGNLFKGQIDEVAFFRRALRPAEIQALVEPGRSLARRPAGEGPKFFDLQLGDRSFSGMLWQPDFLTVRIPAGQLPVTANYAGATKIDHIEFARLPPNSVTAKRFLKFESRVPKLGVHLGLRRDCGHTLTQVGKPQAVTTTKLSQFKFEDAISNYPSPDIQKDNDNYLAGVREIAVRSEFTDGRNMPRLAIASVEFEGPFYEKWPPETHRRIFIESPQQSNRPVYAREIISAFAARAFRRPATTVELDSLVGVWKNSYRHTGNFSQSIKDALLVILTTPQTLFLIEASGGPEPESLTDQELASKLSYFLWNSAPDQRLQKLASANSLRHSVRTEVRRMIDDPRFEQFTSEFVTQWLGLNQLANVEFNRKKFPRLTRDAKRHLKQEPVELIQYLIRQNLSLKNLVHSDFIVANEVVADYYGLMLNLKVASSIFRFNTETITSAACFLMRQFWRVCLMDRKPTQSNAGHGSRGN